MKIIQFRGYQADYNVLERSEMKEHRFDLRVLFLPLSLFSLFLLSIAIAVGAST